MSLALLLSLALAAAPSVAVLAVDDAAGVGVARQEALVWRELLAARGDNVLSVDETRARILRFLVPIGFPLDALKRRAAAAGEAFDQGDLVRGTDILAQLVADLSRDADYSAEKAALLEGARVDLAHYLLALGGEEETGRCETPYGVRAKQALIEALRVNLELSFPAHRFSPKMRRLLDRARESVDAQGRGDMTVTSSPSGAVVFFEGRPIGFTPLKLVDVAPPGRYRVWVAQDARRSVTRWLDIGTPRSELHADLAFEGALVPDGPSVDAPGGKPLDQSVAQRIGRLLGVDHVIFLAVGEDGPRGLRIEVASARLVSRLERAGDGRSLEEARVDAAFALGDPVRATAVEAVEEDSGAATWMAVGVIAGASVLAAAGGVAAWAWATRPREREGLWVGVRVEP